MTCHEHLSSDHAVSYLDDDIPRGTPEVVLKDFTSIPEASKAVGQLLNIGKCELVLLRGTDEERARNRQDVTTHFPLPANTALDDLGYLGAHWLE